VKALFAACEKEESEYLQVRDKAIIAVFLLNGKETLRHARQEQMFSALSRSPQVKFSVQLFLGTGIRATELAELRMGNVCLDPLDAHMKVLGKGGIWGEVGLGVKTQEYLQKYIQMFREPAIQQEVAQLPRKQQEQERHESFLFVNRRGNPMRRSGLWRMTQRLGEWANINSALCVPHAFRRTFAVNFMRQDGNIYLLSKLMRHSSVDVTEVYLTSYLQSEARHQAKSVLDNLY